MAKNKLAKKEIKAFAKRIENIESIDFTKTKDKDGGLLASITVVLKEIGSKSSKLIKGGLDKTITETSQIKDILKKLSKFKKKKSSSQKEKKKKPSKIEVIERKKKKPEKESKNKKKIKKKGSAKTIELSKDKKNAPKKSVKLGQVITPKVAAEILPKKNPTVTESKSDNLRLIDGIGPKIESLLKESGIDTFEKLAKAKPENISSILVEKGGNGLKGINPSTWPEQAVIAAKGNIEELKAYKLRN